MSKATPSEDSFPQRLRLEHARSLAEAENAKYAQRLGYLRQLALSDPEAARAEMVADLKTRPDHAGLLTALLDAHIDAADMEATTATLNALMALDAVPPFWVPRMDILLRDGAIACDGFDIGLDVDTTAPMILRHLAQGSYEMQEARMARALVRSGDRVLELGAGIGFIALSVCSGIDVAAYRAVEANPLLIPLIEANRDRNGARFDVENAVYGRTDGEEQFNIDARFWASSLLDVTRPKDKVTVPARAINAAQAELGANVLIMDIEGGEYAVINALDLSSIDRMIIEFHPERVRDARHTNALQRILRFGFVIDMALSTHKVLALYRPQ